VKIYCLTIYNENFDFFKKIKLVPVGLGSNYFENRWLTDKNNINISNKNPYYGDSGASLNLSKIWEMLKYLYVLGAHHQFVNLSDMLNLLVVDVQSSHQKKIICGTMKILQAFS
jgi:hypothetical protein